MTTVTRRKLCGVLARHNRRLVLEDENLEGGPNITNITNGTYITQGTGNYRYGRMAWHQISMI